MLRRSAWLKQMVLGKLKHFYLQSDGCWICKAAPPVEEDGFVSVVGNMMLCRAQLQTVTGCWLLRYSPLIDPSARSFICRVPAG